MSSKLAYLKSRFGVEVAEATNDQLVDSVSRKKDKKVKKKHKKKHKKTKKIVSTKGLEIKDIQDVRKEPNHTDGFDIGDEFRSGTRKDSGNLSGGPSQAKHHSADELPDGLPKSSTSRGSSSRRGVRHDSSDSDASPPRRRVRHDSSDSDASPPRRRVRHDSSDSDASPPRRRVRHDSSDSDASPPRRRVRHDSSDSDASPPRRLARHKSSDSDASPPRKRHTSPSEKHSGHVASMSTGDEIEDTVDTSTLRTQLSRRLEDDSDSETLHRTQPQSPVGKSGKNKKARMRFSGTTAGLKTGSEFASELKEAKAHQNSLMSEAQHVALGKGSTTVYRDKSGRQVDVIEEIEKKREADAQQKMREAERLRLFQSAKSDREEQERRMKELEAVRSQPFAVTRATADRELEHRIRPDDPMAAFISKEKVSSSGKPLYKGATLPNRFKILPGYRWDGVDRGNGFERKLLLKLNAKGSKQEDAYLWSVADM